MKHMQKTTTTLAASSLLKIISVALVFGMTLCVNAADFNEEQTAYNAAILIMLDRGCTPSFRRTKPYQLSVDALGVTIESKVLRGDCGADDVGVRISWSEPVARENGVPLKPGDVAAYEIYGLSDEPIIAGSGDDYLTNIPPGSYDITIVAVDATGLKSKPSDVIHFTTEGR